MIPALTRAIETGDPMDWQDVSSAFRSIYSSDERARLAAAFLDACDSYDKRQLCNLIWSVRPEDAPLSGHVAAAAEFTTIAPDDVLKVYGAACFSALGPEGRAGFIKWAIAQKGGKK